MGPAHGTRCRGRFTPKKSCSGIRRRCSSTRFALRPAGRRARIAAPAVRRRCTSSRGGPRTAGAGRMGRARRQDRHRCAVRSRGGCRAAVRDRPGRAPSRSSRAARRVDCGAGTVWAGDAQQGFNGSTAYVHWVVDADDAEISGSRSSRLGARWSGSPRSSRGSRAVSTGSSPTTASPCSGPVELMRAARRARPRLRSRAPARSGIRRPPTAPRSEPRPGESVTRSASRSAFGAPTPSTGSSPPRGWVANECNPRFGAGLQYTRAAAAGARPRSLASRRDRGRRSRVTAAAARGSRPLGERRHTLGCGVDGDDGVSWSDSSSLPVVGDAAGYAPPRRDCGRDALVWSGPMGGFVRCEFVADHVPAGASTAPRAVAALAFADAHCARRHRPDRAHRLRALIGATTVRRMGAELLFVTQVAPYRDGPAGVHGVLDQAAVGVAQVAELHGLARATRRRRARAGPRDSDPRARVPSRCSRSARRRGARSSAPRSSTRVRAGRPRRRARSTPRPTRATAGTSTARSSARASTATRGRRPSPPTCSIPQHPACAHLGAEWQLARRGVPVPRPAP